MNKLILNLRSKKGKQIEWKAIVPNNRTSVQKQKTKQTKITTKNKCYKQWIVDNLMQNEIHT